MSFQRQPKLQPLVAPNPADDASQPPSERQRRLATQGTRSTFLGSLAQSSLGPPLPSLTGVGGGG